MNVKSIVSPEVLFIMLLVAAAGYFIMSKIVNKKYGYTKKREKELENIARIYSVEEGKTITFLDLMRRGIQEKYQLGEQNDEQETLS